MNTITAARTAGSVGDYVDLQIAPARAQSHLTEPQRSPQVSSCLLVRVVWARKHEFFVFFIFIFLRDSEE